MAIDNFTASRLHELCRYTPETGIFWRLPSPQARQNNAAMCRKLGSTNVVTGYVFVGVDSAHYYAHRLAWFYTHGVWPSGEIDHMNGDRSDNRIENLRDVPRNINAQNMRKGNSANSSNLLGVTISKQGSGRRATTKWTATIKTNKVRRYLGTFATPELAHAAYLVAKRVDHPGCTI